MTKIHKAVELGTYVSFIAGVQVGQLHVKVVLSMILSQYEVRQSKTAEVKLDSRSTFTAAADGINLEFIKLS